MAASFYGVAVLPGDGIGREVMPPAIDVLEAVGRRHGFGFRWEEYDWSCDRFLKTGAMMPQDGVGQVRRKDAILLWAVGDPRVPDHISLWGMLVPLRQQLRQHACVRPVRLLEAVRSPLADRQPKDIDFIIVRECNVLFAIGTATELFRRAALDAPPPYPPFARRWSGLAPPPAHTGLHCPQAARAHPPHAQRCCQDEPAPCPC